MMNVFCIRKKLSKFSHQPDWENASNYVAKCYMQEQPRSTYEYDVQLQMDSKLWGERYSKKNPPKKVLCFNHRVYAYTRMLAVNDFLVCDCIYTIWYFTSCEYYSLNVLLAMKRKWAVYHAIYSHWSYCKLLLYM